MALATTERVELELQRLIDQLKRDPRICKRGPFHVYHTSRDGLNFRAVVLDRRGRRVSAAPTRDYLRTIVG